MEKLDVPCDQDFNGLLVWADDLKELIDEITRSGGTPVLIADNIKYESIDEFVTLRRGVSPTRVEITSDGYKVRIILNKNYANIHVFSSKYEYLGLFQKLKSILNECKTKTSFLHNPFFGLVPMLFVIPVLLFTKNFALFLYADAISIIVYFASLYLIMYRVAKIRSTYKSEVTTFWARHQDRLIDGTIGAFVGAVLTFGGQYLLNSHFACASSTPSAMSSSEKK